MAGQGGSVRRAASDGAQRVTLKELVGSGDRIALFAAPFVMLGVILQVAYPSLVEVGGPPAWLRVVSLVVSIVGVVVWLWSVVLILTKARRRELITTGPFALVRHPLYTSVSLLVLPWLGFLLDTWLGAAIGLVMYVASRRYAPAEDAVLSDTFGATWDGYAASVKLPWL